MFWCYISLSWGGGMQEHNELVERYDAGADAWSVVELATGAEPFKRAFMSCCVL